MSEVPIKFEWDDAVAFVDDDVIMLKSVDAFGDPVELTCDVARDLALWLLCWSRRLDGENEA